jgi:hypothetical protein
MGPFHVPRTCEDKIEPAIMPRTTRMRDKKFSHGTYDDDLSSCVSEVAILGVLPSDMEAGTSIRSSDLCF